MPELCGTKQHRCEGRQQAGRVRADCGADSDEEGVVFNPQAVVADLALAFFLPAALLDATTASSALTVKAAALARSRQAPQVPSSFEYTGKPTSPEGSWSTVNWQQGRTAPAYKRVAFDQGERVLGPFDGDPEGDDAQMLGEIGPSNMTATPSRARKDRPPSTRRARSR